jgi:hypothetical protein
MSPLSAKNTCKGFSDIDNARKWVLNFTMFYNYEHRHSGLNQLTPIERYSGICECIFANQIAVYLEAKDKIPIICLVILEIGPCQMSCG